MDVTLYLLCLIKTANRREKVVVVRFSDIEVAFPSTAIKITS